jgi:hypothetical protein
MSLVPDNAAMAVKSASIGWYAVAAVYAAVPSVPPVPTFSVDPSVPVSVNVFDDVNVLPSAIVTVEPVAGAVNVTLLIVVADATPSVGVVKVGEVAKTNAPDPVSSVTAEARFALDGVARNVATPVPSPVILPTAGVIVDALAAVTKPFPLTVKATDCVAEPKEPTLLFTVASVKAVEPVASPV